MKPFIQKCSEVLSHVSPKWRALATWKSLKAFQWNNEITANSTAKMVLYSTAKIPVGTFNYIKKYTHFVSILSSSKIGLNPIDKAETFLVIMVPKRKQWQSGVHTRQFGEPFHMQIWRFASPSSTPAMPVPTSEFLLMTYHFRKQFKIQYYSQMSRFSSILSSLHSSF